MSLLSWIDAEGRTLADEEGLDPAWDNPRREIWIGVAAISVFIAFIGLWAGLAPLDEGLTASGQVMVSGNRQTVQTKDGGVVGRLLVHEGDHVVQGQVLIDLDVSELKASAQALSNTIVEQKALERRLNAELTGASGAGAPSEAAASPNQAVAASAARLQAMEFARRRAALQADQGVLREQIGEIQEQVRGLDRQIEANRQEQALGKQELDSLKDLAEQGYVPTSRLRQLQRSQSELQGAAGQLEAQRASALQQIGEHKIKMQGILAERDVDDSHTFRDSEMSLAELEPKFAAAQQQIDRAVIRAPVSGRVVGLTVYTLGAVVGPGQKLMDVVPDDRPLVIDARVKPGDAQALRLNQRAEVRVAALHGARLPTITGKVTRISADALTDDKSGASYFTIEVQVSPEEAERLGEGALRPGYPADVVLPLRSRTALGYLLEPLTRSFWTAFRQH